MEEYSPKEKIQKAIVKVGTDRGFFGHLIFSLNHKQDRGIRTLAINRAGNMKYNPEFVDKLNLEHVKTLVTHEIMHPAFSHFDRAGSRRRKLWNYATDLSINSKLKAEGFEFPEVSDVFEDAPDEAMFLVPDNYDSYDFGSFKVENCSEKSSEEIYSEIDDKMPEIKISLNMDADNQDEDADNSQNGDGNNQGEKESENKDGNDGSGEDKDQEDGQSDSQGQGNQEGDGEDQGESDSGFGGTIEIESNGEKREVDNFGDIGEAIGDMIDEDEVPDVIPVPMDNHDYSENPDGMGDEEVEKEQKSIEQSKERAMNHAKRQGQIPAGIEVEINAEEEAKVDWKQVLQRFVTNSMPHDYTFTRPNRRYQSRGITLPSEKRESIDIAVAVDTSGSVSDNELREFLGEMYGMMEGFSKVDMTVIQHDSEVQKTTEIDSVEDLEDLQIKGRGGTNHIPVFKWIKENKPNARVLINLTDGYTSSPDESDVPGTLNTIWLVNNYDASESRMPFGKIIRQPSNFLETE